MKTGRVFWGILFIVVGTLILLEKTNVISLEWHGVWRFWPLILVFLGVAVLARNRGLLWIAVGLAALCLGVVLVSVISSAVGHEDEETVIAGGGSQEFMETSAGPVSRASLSIDAGAGAFQIADTTSQLFTASTRSTLGEYRVTRETSEGVERVSLRMEGQRHGWRFGRFENRAVMKLNPGTEWDLDVDVGAAKVDFDLSSFSVKHLGLNTGAASVKLKLGGLADEARVSINAGASSIRIWVPDSAGCEIRAEAPLSNKNFRGFEKLGSGYYRTENFDRASKRIEITVDAGISNIKVVRY